VVSSPVAELITLTGSAGPPSVAIRQRPQIQLLIYGTALASMRDRSKMMLAVIFDVRAGTRHLLACAKPLVFARPSHFVEQGIASGWRA